MNATCKRQSNLQIFSLLGIISGCHACLKDENIVCLLAGFGTAKDRARRQVERVTLLQNNLN